MATLHRFRPHLLLELTSDHLARAGDRLDDAFAFLEGLGYAAFELTSGGGLVPVTAPCDAVALPRSRKTRCPPCFQVTISSADSWIG